MTIIQPAPQTCVLAVDPLEHYLGRSALLPGEDRAAYDAFYAEVAAALRPVDLLDAIRVRDIVAQQWDVERYRRTKVELLKAGVGDGLDLALKNLIENRSARSCSSNGVVATGRRAATSTPCLPRLA